MSERLAPYWRAVSQRSRPRALLLILPELSLGFSEGAAQMHKWRTWLVAGIGTLCAGRRCRLREQQLVQLKLVELGERDILDVVDAERECDGRRVGPIRGQEQGHADRRSRRQLRAERVRRFGRPHGDRDGRRSDEGDRRGDGPEGQRCQRAVRQHYPRPRRPASTTSAHRHSPTRRSARRPSTSSRTSQPVSPSIRRPRAGRRSTRSLTSAATQSPSSKGTTEKDDATAQSVKCKKAGKPGVTVLVVP